MFVLEIETSSDERKLRESVTSTANLTNDGRKFSIQNENDKNRSFGTLRKKNTVRK